jgi:hypothetical protein
VSTQEDEKKESLLSRWSRRKQEARDRPPQEATKPSKAPEATPQPELPPLDTLSFESDFKGFMDSRVDDAVRRIALKKLFSDPRFNITDGLDDYAENYAALEDLAPTVVERLQHARRILHGPETEDKDAPEARTAEEQRIEQPKEEQELRQRSDADAAAPTQDDEK